ncbi:MAG: GDSL-type esterase/lipase family protein [Ferruginibacter sp.]
MIRKIITSVLIILSVNFLWAQDSVAPFYNDIQHFKKQDSSSFPPTKAILFIGSSSFTKWVDVKDYFPGHTIVNRGFGGSSLPDVTRYVKDIVFPYKPGQVVIYCGENDIAGADSITAKIVFNRFKQLFQLIRSKMPKVPIAYVSMKPSPSREKFWPKMIAGNSLIKNYLKTKPKTAFIDVYHKMLNKDGTVMKDIFIEDNLHMNAKGYAIWKKVIEPYLL